MAEKKNLCQRLLAITKDIGAVAKEGRMRGSGGNFDFHQIDDVEEKLRPLFVKHGVSVFPQVEDIHTEAVKVNKTSKGKSYEQVQHSLSCTVSVIFVNSDDMQDTARASAPAEGIDYSDKAPGKALSYGVKNIYLSVFHLRGQPDNESDDIQRVTPARRNTTPPSQPSPATTSNGRLHAIKKRYAAKYPAAKRDNWVKWTGYQLKELESPDDERKWGESHLSKLEAALSKLEEGE